MATIKHILVPTDFSDSSACALQHAVSMAKSYDAKITVLHVVTIFEKTNEESDTATDSLKELYSNLTSHAMQQIKSFIDKYQTQNINAVVVSGFSIAEEILLFVMEEKIDFIIAGTLGRNPLAKILLGSVTEKLVKIAPCPIMTIKAYSFKKNFRALRRYLVCVDFSDYSHRALMLAKKMATKDAEIHVLHVIEDVLTTGYQLENKPSITKLLPDLQSISARTLDKFINDAKIREQKVHPILEIGNIVDKIIEYTEDEQIDIIYLGVKGMIQEDSILIGRIPERIIRKSSCPVIIVK